MDHITWRGRGMASALGLPYPATYAHRVPGPRLGAHTASTTAHAGTWRPPQRVVPQCRRLLLWASIFPSAARNEDTFRRSEPLCPA